MDGYQTPNATIHLRRTVSDQTEIIQYGRFVGNALESLHISRRALIIKEIRRLQDAYRRGVGQQCNLSLQMMKIEHYRMNPGFYEDPDNRRDYVPKNYGDAMVAYVASVPFPNRVQAVNDVCSIAYAIAGDEFVNIVTKEKVCEKKI